MAELVRTVSSPLVGIAFWRENPGPPERPDWEGGGWGNNQWYFGLLAVLLVVVLLVRLLGPLGLVVLWGVGLLGFAVVKTVKALGQRKNPKP